MAGAVVTPLWVPLVSDVALSLAVTKPRLVFGPSVASVDTSVCVRTVGC